MILELIICVLLLIGVFYFGKSLGFNKKFDVDDFKRFLEFYNKNKEKVDIFLSEFATKKIIAKGYQGNYDFEIKKWIIKRRN